MSMLAGTAHDVKLAVRSLLRERSVTAVALGSLAIGIAANATVFSLLQAVEFPRLIYPDASRIVFLESRNTLRDLTGLLVSAPDALDVAAATRTLDTPALTADQTSVVREATTPVRRSGRQVTPAFFRVMRVAPSQGRVLAEGDGADVIIISDRLWRTQFARVESPVGRQIHLDDAAHTIVGVMPERFDLDADFWTMLPPSIEASPRDDRRFTMFSRIAPGVTLEQARRELSAISARLESEHPATNRGWTLLATQMTRMHGQDSRGVFFLLQGAVGIVLLIACANIANILLARGTRRTHDMALCIALGASRGRLLRQLLTESLLLAGAGGALGVLLTVWGIRLARALGGFPDVIDPALNVGVLVFAAAVSMLTGVLSGIVPALRASGTAPETALRADGGRGGTGRARGRLRTALVAIQVASAVVLSTSAGLMVQTLVNRYRVDLGFNPRGAARADVAFTGSRYAAHGVLRSSVDATIERITSRPGIVAAGASAFAMSQGVGAQQELTLANDGSALHGSVRRSVEAVTPGYFDAMGIPLRSGRPFVAADRPGSAAVAIVNEELAGHLWPNRSPIGQVLRLGPASGPAPLVTVVGVAGTVRRSAMHGFGVARVYVPYAQDPRVNVTLVARAQGDVRLALAEMQTAVRQTDAALVLDDLRTVA